MINRNKVWEDQSLDQLFHYKNFVPPPLLQVLKITILFPVTSIASSLKNEPALTQPLWASPTKRLEAFKMSFICTLLLPANTPHQA